MNFGLNLRKFVNFLGNFECLVWSFGFVNFGLNLREFVNFELNLPPARHSEPCESKAKNPFSNLSILCQLWILRYAQYDEN